MQYDLLPLVKIKLQHLNHYFMLSDTFGHKLFLKEDKHENVSKMIIQGNIN